MIATRNVVDRYFLALGKRQRAIRGLIAVPVCCWGVKEWRRVQATSVEFDSAYHDLCIDPEVAARVLGAGNYYTRAPTTPMAPLLNGKAKVAA